MGLIELIAMLAMVCLNGVFAGYEIALASINIGRLQLLLRDNRAGAKAALYMKQNMEGSLATMQVVITLLGAIAAAIGGAGAQQSIKPLLRDTFGLSSATAAWLAIALVVIPLTFITIMVGELIPKVFSMRHPEWVCLRLSPAMRWFSFAAWPAVWLFESSVQSMMTWGERRWGTRFDSRHKGEANELTELRAHAAYARATRLIGEKEEDIIVGAARLSSRMVREVMLPAAHISLLRIDAPMGECLVTAHLDMHTRFPVAERPHDPQSILGYVNFKDLVALMRLSQPHEASLRAVLRPLPSLRDSIPLSACLERLIREHTHIALVRSDAGEVVGLITLEDILEELVGDIQDEYDRLPVHAVPSGRAWVVGGGLSLARLRELTGIDLIAEFPSTAPSTLSSLPSQQEDVPADPVLALPDTADVPPQTTTAAPRNVSDWILAELHHVVRGGEIIDQPGLRVVVRKVRRQKVLESQIGRVSPPNEIV
jgi:putative hemolysin